MYKLMLEKERRLDKILKKLKMRREKTPNFILNTAQKLIDEGFEEEASKLLSNYKRFEKNIMVAYKYGIQLVQDGLNATIAAAQMLEKLIEIEKKTSERK